MRLILRIFLNSSVFVKFLLRLGLMLIIIKSKWTLFTCELQTKKNAFKLVDGENHVYEQHRKSEKVIYWKCERSYFGCKSRVRTSPDNFGTDVPRIAYRSEVAHNHPADRAKVSARSNMLKLKQSISGSRTCVPTREAVCFPVAIYRDKLIYTKNFGLWTNFLIYGRINYVWININMNYY